MSRLDAAALMKTAAVQTGLDYSDRAFVEPLERLLASLDVEGNLGEAGIEGLRQDVVRLLTNRLLIEAAIAANPAILDEDVSDPIVITGLPRTGSTKLQKVLATSARYRALPLWQALFPAPLAPPGTDPDPRITIADEQSALMFQRFPDLMAAHPMSTTEPEEEVLLLQLSFRVPANGWFYRAPSYVEWIERQDQSPAYQDLRRTLQYLQWQDGGRRDRAWVLKSPAHLGGLALVLAAFPNATVVHCHRAISEALPSLARLLELMQLSRGAEQVDNHELGAFLQEYCAGLWDRNIEQRAELPAAQILDVSYDTVRDDIGSVLELIHTRRGVQLGHAEKDSMLRWEQANPQHRFGTHRYSLERYGLTEAELQHAFAGYLARFPY